MRRGGFGNDKSAFGKAFPTALRYYGRMTGQPEVNRTLAGRVELKVGSTKTTVNVTALADSIPNANPAIKVGPWTDTPLQDLPYSMTVVPSTLIDNLQGSTQDDVYKLIPEITTWTPMLTNTGNDIAEIRGFPVSQTTYLAGQSYDGLIGAVGGESGQALEDKDRVEVLSGVDGFLYGIASVGGNINYVVKRPSQIPYYSITVGDNAGANGYVHGDFSGPINKMVDYRLNIAYQNGATSVLDQSIKRNLVSPVLDIHLLPNLLVQLNYSHTDFTDNGSGVSFSFTNAVTVLPHAPDPSRVGFPSWTQFAYHTDTVLGWAS